MSEFDITDWCDYVRGVAEPELERAILKHLEKTPAEPGSTPSLFRHIEAAARTDRELAVPDDAVENVHSIFDIERPKRTPFRFLSYEVVYDSLLQPEAVGTRNLQSSSRQIIVESLDFVVDVRVEQESYPAGKNVLGQLLRRGEEDDPMPDVPVLVVTQGGKIRRTETGPFGEFQDVGLEDEPKGLYLFVDRRDCIGLSFDDPENTGDERRSSGPEGVRSPSSPRR